MRIGIDVDDTITDTHEYVINLKKKYFKDYNPNEPLPEAVFLPFIDAHEREIHQNVSLKSGAKEALDYFHESGYEIIILSSRGSYYNEITKDTAYQDTYDYFLKNNLPFNKIIVNLEDKVEAAKENKIDIFIDDKIGICESFKNTGIKVIKMSRYDDYKTDLIVANNWNEVIKIIEEMN